MSAQSGPDAMGHVKTWNQSLADKRRWLAETSGQWTLGLFVVFLICFVNYQLFRVKDNRLCGDDDSFVACQEKLFKEGSLGGEISTGIPYRIFKVLPKVFGDTSSKAPSGYQRFGFQQEVGQDLPLGFAKRKIGYERVTINCALCHVASYRFGPEQEPTLVIGGPAHSVDVQAYLEFLRQVAHEANAKRWDEGVLNAIMDDMDDNDEDPLSWIEEPLYRYLLIPWTRNQLASATDRLFWFHDSEQRHWGPGRADSINRIKVEVLDGRDDGSIGHADIPSIWNLGQRRGQAIYWGGEVRSVKGALIDHALALGAPPGPETEKRIADLQDFLGSRPAPRLLEAMSAAGMAPEIDEKRIEKGKKVFDEACGDCHGFGGKHVGEVVPVATVGTDPMRFNSWTQQDADRSSEVTTAFGDLRDPMTKTKGYVARPLDGLWLRAPYLHNGSVPNIWELLKAPEQRLPKFQRGCDIYDVEHMGFVIEAPQGICLTAKIFDTTKLGNDNSGHAYGVELSRLKKKRLIDYLKTL